MSTERPYGKAFEGLGKGMSSRFSFDAAARAVSKQQILDGHNMLGGGATACMCTSDRACRMSGDPL